MREKCPKKMPLSKLVFHAHKNISYVRSMDTLGGGNILRDLDSLGHGYILRDLDHLGGGNILRSMDGLGDGYILRGAGEEMEKYKRFNFLPPKTF